VGTAAAEYLEKGMDCARPEEGGIYRCRGYRDPHTGKMKSRGDKWASKEGGQMGCRDLRLPSFHKVFQMFPKCFELCSITEVKCTLTNKNLAQHKEMKYKSLSHIYPTPAWRQLLLIVSHVLLEELLEDLSWF
jgi:hypothetical protein